MTVASVDHLTQAILFIVLICGAVLLLVMGVRVLAVRAQLHRTRALLVTARYTRMQTLIRVQAEAIDRVITDVTGSKLLGEEFPQQTLAVLMAAHEQARPSQIN